MTVPSLRSPSKFFILLGGTPLRGLPEIISQLISSHLIKIPSLSVNTFEPLVYKFGIESFSEMQFGIVLTSFKLTLINIEE